MNGKMYLFNKQSHTLHIKGFCHYSKGVNDYIPFLSEDEAIASDGRASLCKFCQKARDKKLEVML